MALTHGTVRSFKCIAIKGGCPSKTLSCLAAFERASLRGGLMTQSGPVLPSHWNLLNLKKQIFAVPLGEQAKSSKSIHEGEAILGVPRCRLSDFAVLC